MSELMVQWKREESMDGRPASRVKVRLNIAGVPIVKRTATEREEKPAANGPVVGRKQADIPRKKVKLHSRTGRPINAWTREVRGSEGGDAKHGNSACCVWMAQTEWLLAFYCFLYCKPSLRIQLTRIGVDLGCCHFSVQSLPAETLSSAVSDCPPTLPISLSYMLPPLPSLSAPLTLSSLPLLPQPPLSIPSSPFPVSLFPPPPPLFQEEELLIQGVQEHGFGRWLAIRQSTGIERSSSQMHQRYQRLKKDEEKAREASAKHRLKEEEGKGRAEEWRKEKSREGDQVCVCVCACKILGGIVGIGGLRVT